MPSDSSSTSLASVSHASNKEAGYDMARRALPDVMVSGYMTASLRMAPNTSGVTNGLL